MVGWRLTCRDYAPPRQGSTPAGMGTPLEKQGCVELNGNARLEVCDLHARHADAAGPQPWVRLPSGEWKALVHKTPIVDGGRIVGKPFSWAIVILPPVRPETLDTLAPLTRTGAPPSVPVVVATRQTTLVPVPSKGYRRQPPLGDGARWGRTGEQSW
ncbi:unnamed protein product [Protopolystoma xenopodis]|uniref:Uncharacterized protein n=1 Tax=Protopolystoma xenopodis TaxID=117903 RepID=A0A448WK57_9PLAT|nr:unnamed protein product [Protopolystoma xenopodis]